MGEGMELYLCQRQLGGSWGIAILTILVDRHRSFWSGRLGERINEFNPMVQGSLRQGAGLLQHVGLPHAHAQAGSMGLLHARLLIQSVVNAFVDTFAYQACIGTLAVLLVLFFARGRRIATAAHAIHATR
jgi:DHA2 family multidrug resistance protein